MLPAVALLRFVITPAVVDSRPLTALAAIVAVRPLRAAARAAAYPFHGLTIGFVTPSGATHSLGSPEE